MSLRQVAVFFSLFLVFILAGFLVSYRWFVEIPRLTSNLNELQNRELAVLYRGLNNEIEFLKTLNWDYAAWDDTYEFIEKFSKDFIDSNFEDETFQSIKIDAAFFYDLQGSQIWSKGIDYETNEKITFDELDFTLTPTNLNILPLYTGGYDKIMKYGFLTTSHGPVIYTVSPIIKPDFSAPAIGYLLFIRKIRPVLFESLSAISQLSLEVLPVSQLYHFKLAKPLQGSLQGESFAQARVRFLANNKGEPVVLLRIKHGNVPRLSIVDEQSVMLMTLLLVVLFALLISMNRLIVKPIENAANLLQKMTRNEKFHQIEYPSLITEMATLTDGFNCLISEVNSQREKLEKLSSTDPLTGIANRRAFSKGYEHAWQRSKRLNHPIVVMLADIDFFKSFNDNYGHQAGDEALCFVADALCRTFARDTDLVARYGGEEFVIVLESISFEDCRTLSEECLKAVRDLPIEHDFSGARDGLSISLGVAIVSDWFLEPKLLSPDEFLEKADKALYQAKNTGRDRVCFWQSHD